MQYPSGIIIATLSALEGTEEDLMTSTNNPLLQKALAETDSSKHIYCNDCHKYCRIQEYYRRRLATTEKKFEEYKERQHSEQHSLLNRIKNLKEELERTQKLYQTYVNKSVVFKEEMSENA